MWDVWRVAVDIDLDQPIVLSVEVSVHVCASCSRMFRTQPPFLRPRGIYTRRVVQKAVEAVYRDGLAARSVPSRLARDFWVRPIEKMVRLWPPLAQLSSAREEALADLPVCSCRQIPVCRRTIRPEMTDLDEAVLFEQFVAAREHVIAPTDRCTLRILRVIEQLIRPATVRINQVSL